MTVRLTSNFFANARGLSFLDTASVTWSLNPATNELSAAGAGGVTGLGNPTTKVGLSVVNGSATTAMRSDGAPQLDQSIAPTWTGLHTFGNNVVVNGSGTGPTLTVKSPGTPFVTIAATAVASSQAAVCVAGNGTTAGSTSLDLMVDGTGVGWLLQRANAFLQIGVNATPGIRITSAPLVQILGGGTGSTSPNFAGAGRALLQLNGSTDNLLEFAINGATQSYLFGSASELRIATWTGGQVLNFWTNNTARMSIDASGKVTHTGPIGWNGAAAPTQVTGFGTPVGGAVVASYNITDAGGANSNTNKCVAEILTVMKAHGMIGA